jgi:hypothetical protein
MSIDIHRLLVRVEHVKSQFIAFGDQLPMLFAPAGIDDMLALRALGPFAVAMRKGVAWKARLKITAKIRNMMFSLVAGVANQ